VGPDLTHLASRRGLASNSLPNQHAYLSAWITHAQSLKPGAEMPNLTDFTGEELQELSAYLLALE
jgi:cytochrome c oxidase subunit 2